MVLYFKRVWAYWKWCHVCYGNTEHEEGTNKCVQCGTVAK